MRRFPASGSVSQRCCAVLLVARMQVGAVVQKHRRAFDVTVPGKAMERA